MEAKSNKRNLPVMYTGRERRFNFNLTGADFDINDTEFNENQDYNIREEVENDNLNLGGDDFYRQTDEG
jgi:hypothetical protein